MAWHPLDLMEPEETVGKLWHDMAEGMGAGVHHPGAAVALADVRTSLGVLFRALGGAAGVELLDAPAQLVQHQRSLRRRVAVERDKIQIARFFGLSIDLVLLARVRGGRHGDCDRQTLARARDRHQEYCKRVRHS